MNEFKTYHPIVNFLYFLFVTGFSMFFMHPVCLVISFVCGFSYSLILGSSVKSVVYIIPVLFFTALINPLFNHKGVTILLYLPSGNPLTLESIVYGLCAAVLLVSVICWFFCYSKVMTSDKFIYLFGRAVPSLSLVISMTLGFVPKFAAQLKKTADLQKCMGFDISSGSIFKRAKHGLRILSSVTTWALENSIDTSDSMKARGYGLKGCTAFSIYKFDKRDKKILMLILFLSAYTLFGKLNGAIQFTFFPSIAELHFDFFEASVFLSYFILCLCPIIIEFWEVKKWKALKSKI